MSKFIKRIGTTATKYMFEFSSLQVELNLIQPCKIGIILKRGDHVEETKKNSPLEKGLATFPDKLGIPATLYFDKKKNCYITKEASITINVITTKVTRLAGVTKIDLAQFANKNTTEEDVAQNIEKCFDKNAKVHFKIKMVKVSDVIAERKSRKGNKDKKKPLDKSDGGTSDNNRDRSQSPFTSQIGEDSDAPDFTDNSSLPDLSERRDKSSDMRVNYNSDNEIAVKGRSKTAVTDSLKLGRASLSDGKAGANRFATEALSEITSSVNESMVQPQNVLELEVKARNYQRENKELYAKIQENNEEYLNLKQDYEDLKYKYDKLKREYDGMLTSGSKRGEQATFGPVVSDGNNKNKVAELEREIEELTKERDEANERADELQQSTQDLLVKIETYKNKEKRNNNKSNNTHELEEYIVKVNDLQQKLKESEIIIKELSNPQKERQGDQEQLELENQMLKTKVEQCEEKIDDLERQLGIQLKELEIMKKMRNKEETSNQALEQMEKKQKGLEDTYKKRIDDLTKQNGELKKEVEGLKDNLSSAKLDAENELARLSLENESLKKQMKDANGRLLNAKYDNKEMEEMRRRLVQYENEKEKVDSELVKAKMGWASSDKERDETRAKLKSQEQSSKQLQERSELMEGEVFRLRTRMAELMNIVMEYGEMDLLDKIEEVITQDGGNQ